VCVRIRVPVCVCAHRHDCVCVHRMGGDKERDLR
jgi:hypothetical protein